uniref:21 kDa protein n=1 Tax=Grapevine leafroll-associated virus 3 TaxID=55951 RepID=A0A2S0M2W9_9CLOS|nr:21 kDa protein [Grapevine leafroll-associated virus 3]AXI81994.1 21 kDa protein [Grapevine leafroll-associated virus 3]AXI82006.1 21 kDa protein [Grapevine leafroll-associated virus 3]AXI82031.1 21 kDa protein [Grapevine leafroll-associated virus 3]
MEFRPVLVTVSYEPCSTVGGIKVLAYDLQYDNIFDNCEAKSFKDSESGYTVVKEYTTNSAFILSPYKLFSAVFNKEGEMISNDVGSSFRVYNVFPQMRKDINRVCEIHRAGYLETYLGDGQADVDIFFEILTDNRSKVRWFVSKDHTAWSGLLNDLKWEESNKEKFKGRDILDTYILSSDYPGFK